MRRERDLVVVKIGGAEGNESQALVKDIAALREEGRRVILVHGGSEATTKLAESLGEPVEFIESPSGQVSRATNRRTVEIFIQATALINASLVEELAASGVEAFGFSAASGAVVSGRRKPAARARRQGKTIVLRDQWTGRPVSVRKTLLESLLDQGLVCVVAPQIAGETGAYLNVDGDRLAATIAAALQADDLVFLTNVPGLLRNAGDPESLLTEVTDFETAHAVAGGRMKKKVMAAEEAVNRGVGSVTIASSRTDMPLLAALSGAGTRFAVPAREKETGVQS